MRQIATLPDEVAQTFADYLLTLKIQTRLEREKEGTAVWVCDEDRVPQARQELTEFNRNPSDSRYRSAGSTAEALRREEAKQEEAYSKRQRDLQLKMRGLSVVHRPVTITLITICVVVALATNFGTRNEPVLRALSIASYQTLVSDQQSTMIVWNHLDDIWSGQVWRLVTPIFIHFGLMHLAFNMLMLLSLGGQVESSRGPWRYLLLVLLFAIASNLGQYYLGRPILANGNIILRSSPLFGGMSGVLYGLFGYMWMKARFEPRLGLAMPNETVVILVGWFFLCLVGVIPNVANAAHGVGLLLGLLIGCAPTFWRWLRGDDQLDV